ncbi:MULTISPECIES: hypothetical protein [unclassified Nocardioides]|uniref:hypothetical protein n=1 Tax=unclassified Nocardioides TaxID=2615069 RepID=UPI003015305C
MKVTVDRDSVAMGDDTESHERTLDVPGETTLGAFLAHLTPGVSVAGSATWVVRLGGRGGDWVGMYDGQMRVLREAERTLADLGATGIYFDYWAGAPAELLLESLAAGRLPAKDALQREGWRRGWQAEDDRARAKAATTTRRLLSAEAVAAVAALGGRIEVHAPSYCRLVGADGTTYVVTADQHWSRVSTVDEAGDRRGLGTFRPPGPLAETTLVARLGATWRATRGLDPVEPPRHRTTVSRSGGIWRWTFTDGGVEHEGRYWPDGTLAAALAPYARLEVPEITALFTAGDAR